LLWRARISRRELQPIIVNLIEAVAQQLEPRLKLIERTAAHRLLLFDLRQRDGWMRATNRRSDQWLIVWHIDRFVDHPAKRVHRVSRLALPRRKEERRQIETPRVRATRLARGSERATHFVASIDRFSSGRHFSHDADAIVIVKR